MSNDMDIRLIIRTGRRIKVTDNSQTTLYHIRGVIDEDHVVVRHFVRPNWMYKLIHMDTFATGYKCGKLS